MFNIEEFDEIRPYYDEEVPVGIKRVISSPLIYKVIGYLFPDKDPDEIIKTMRGISTVFDFQSQIMSKVVRSIISQSSNGLTFSGLENLSPNSSYLFVANHRDIVVDSCLLQLVLFENNFPTSEVTFGSNLMREQFLVDVGKMNKMFKVDREAIGREFYKSSKKLSNYLRYTITEKKESAWIAQRNGRTKDGDDKTEVGVLKMFNISGNKDFVENFRELRIVPITMSYEFEPCDILKIRELYLSKKGPYIKKEDEDINSILSGIKGHKGRMNIAFGTPIVQELEAINEIPNENDKFRQLALEIDNQIYRDFKLWPNNYIAYDLLNKGNKYEKKYSPEAKAAYVGYAQKKVDSVDDVDDKKELYTMFLELYANPVVNSEKVIS